MLFGKWSGTEVKIDGQELLIMKESDIMGVLDEVRTREWSSGDRSEHAGRSHAPPATDTDH